ncbi:UDP-N-acetylglucosamine 1-carboxyvinyltransferase [Rickettsiella endosymbiont of Dermanyssus gallinae]|uniref:UDP-N-acetylglucosamine 1-carboxyvinyltransferase n=1 Tax=Rickettsiella endosymbiont of Dermanyssus gallinae TaxID=2856608 RepID=UPI001C532C32|nr:hypothetical protein [Rickettsiella endosymbiont of Dermanyssus gallinae]
MTTEILTPMRATPSLISLGVSTAKNSILPLLAASIICKNETTFLTSKDFCLIDVDTMLDMLKLCGVNVMQNNDSIHLDCSCVHQVHLKTEYTEKTRYSIILFGALLARFGECSTSLPGGCDLGRKYDIHLDIMRQLGFYVEDSMQGIKAIRTNKASTLVKLRYPSVGATLNALIIASNSEPQNGEVIQLVNCAIEPEIDNLIEYLVKLGCAIERNWRTISITRAKRINIEKVWHAPIRDRIEAGSFALAAALLGSKIIIQGAPIKYMDAVIALLVQLNVYVFNFGDALVVDGCSINRSMTININTEPYPGFPTDLQPILAALCSAQSVPCAITDTVMPERTKYIASLNALGANLRYEQGVIKVFPAYEACPNKEIVSVTATDLRAGMAVILYALKQGRACRIENFFQVRRGYSNVEEIIRSLGGELQCNVFNN